MSQYAQKHGFDIMLGYGALEKSSASAMVSAHAVDSGFPRPAYSAGGVDVSDDLLRSLNDNYRAARNARPNPDEGDSQ